MTNLKDMRMDYPDEELARSGLRVNPFQQFELWFNEAIAQGVPEANAVILATAGADLRVSSRVMLLKYFDETGFVFFTNYNSHKGQQIAENARASLLFWWQPCHRQVRIEGILQKIDPKDSDEYFAERDRASQLAALASNQSQPIEKRQELMDRYHQLEQQYANVASVPRPSHWGGYRLVPDYVEFWQGVAHRLHDRFCFQMDEDQKWRVSRLAP